MESTSKRLPPELAVIDPRRILVPVATAVLPFAGIPVGSTGRPSVVLDLRAIEYGEMTGGGHVPTPTHSAQVAFDPNILAVVTGQLLACAHVAGWDLATLGGGINAAQDLAMAAFRDADPLTFGVRIQ